MIKPLPNSNLEVFVLVFQLIFILFGLKISYKHFKTLLMA